MGNMDKVFRSAVFIDFDNIFLSLKNQDSKIADRFAYQPLQWITWLEKSLPLHGIQDSNVRRKILVRRCYLNPKSFGVFRPYLIRSAIETIDCPVLTAGGKTSADVHMVLDIIELMDNEIFFDEFIIMSADADFTPVLLKLRKSDRRTCVVAIGPSSSAYQAASDLVIDQDVFLEEALGVAEEETQEISKPCVEQEPPLTEELRVECSRLIRENVSASHGPVPMAVLAGRLRNTYSVLSPDWLGFVTFKTFLAELDLSELCISNIIPGYVYDPKKHTPPVDTEYFHKEDVFGEKYSEIALVAKRINQLTDTPYLLPEEYVKLFQNIASDINDNGYNFVQVSKNVRDKCKEANISIGRQQVNFVLRGISFAGHRFGVNKENSATLSEYFYKNTLTLCGRAQLSIPDKEGKLLEQWLVSSEG